MNVTVESKFTGDGLYVSEMLVDARRRLSPFRIAETVPLSAALVLNFTVALVSPTATGVKLAVNPHEVPAANGTPAPHPLVVDGDTEYSAAFVPLTDDIGIVNVNGALPTLFTSIPTVVVWFVFKFVSGKVKLPKLRRSSIAPVLFISATNKLASGSAAKPTGPLSPVRSTLPLIAPGVYARICNPALSAT